MQKLISRLFSRNSTKVKPFKPQITSVYDKFIEEDLTISKQSWPSNSSQTDSNFAHESPETSSIRDTTTFTNAITQIDLEAAELLKINPNHLFKIEDRVLENESFIKNDLLYDPTKEKKHFNFKTVIKRIEKDYRWGLGGQLMKRKKEPFKKNKIPEIEDLVMFLEKELLKDVKIIDMKEHKREAFCDISILVVGYSNRHIYKAAKALVTELNKLNVNYSNLPRIFGRKDDEWLMVNVGKLIFVHFFTENMKEEIDLEKQWSTHDFDDIDDDYKENVMKKKKDLDNPFKFRNV